MKRLILLSFLFTSCGIIENEWRVYHEPANDAERAAASEHVQKVMQYFPKSAGGNDQDYDDALRVAHDEARHLFCTPVLVEIQSNGHPTGNRKPLPNDALKPGIYFYRPGNQPSTNTPYGKETTD